MALSLSLTLQEWISQNITTGSPRPPPTGVSARSAYLLRRRCGSFTSSPPARLDRRRLVFPPARLAYYAAVVGRLRLHRPACLRRRRLVFPPARLAYYAAVVVRLRLDRPACLRRRRLVFPPARLTYYAAIVGRLHLHRLAA